MKKIFLILFLIPAFVFAQSDADNQTQIDSLLINSAKKNNAKFFWRMLSDLNTSKINHNDVNALQSGLIMYWSTTTAPNGWLLCDGSAVSRTTYANLFAAIDSTFGAGDHHTTFNLPNGGGNFIAGYKSSDSDYNAINKTGGEKTHILTSTEMPVHNHTISDPGHDHHTAKYNSSDADASIYPIDNTVPIATFANWGSATAQYNLKGNGTGAADVGLTSTQSTGITINNTGSGSAHENRPPFITLSMIIKQ